MDSLELELRAVPGVDGVGFSEDGGALTIHLLASDAGAVPEVRRQVAQRARAHVEGPAILEIETPAGSLSPRLSRPAGGRVQLLAVRKVTFTQEVEVHLSRGDTRTVGRAKAESPTAAVTATLEALSALGADLPFRPEAATVAVGPSFEAAVVVRLEAEAGGGTRYGVARAATLEEAACQATLHALNRYLVRGEAFEGGSG